MAVNNDYLIPTNINDNHCYYFIFLKLVCNCTIHFLSIDSFYNYAIIIIIISLYHIQRICVYGGSIETLKAFRFKKLSYIMLK